MSKRHRRPYKILSHKEYVTIKKMIRAKVSPTSIKKETGREYATIKRVKESRSWADYTKDRQGKKYRPTHKITDQGIERLRFSDHDPIDDAISREINKARSDANTWKFFAISASIVLVLYVIISMTFSR